MTRRSERQGKGGTISHETRSRLRVAVGERPLLLLAGLVRLLDDAGLDVCCAASEPQALARGLPAAAPEVSLLDARLANGDGPLDFLAVVREACPELRIVVLLDKLTAELAHAAMLYEVDGVVLGSESPEAIVEALSQVAAGHAVFPAGWLGMLHRAETQSVFARLSGRQLEVLELLATGLDNQRIAELLQISRNTVKFHVRVIYERLGVTNRVQAAAVLGDAIASTGSARA